MFARKGNNNSLEVPPIAKENPEAVEILRVWAAPGAVQQLTIRPVWKDAGAWGLMLVDIARHVAKAYGNQGEDPDAVLARIHEFFEKEWNYPTDIPKDITKG